jgi:phosphocarrier protein HPr
MYSQTFIVRNPSGIHTRPARLFVDTATESFPSCEVYLIKGSKRINGKSMLGMLTLGVKQGDEVTLEAEGDQETEAVKELGQIIEKIFEE